MSSPVQVGAATRQYRCQKRQKPCDHCRERKLKCQTDNTIASNAGGGGNDRPPCQRCARTGIPCTYVGRPRRRTSAMPAISSALNPNDTAISVTDADTSEIDTSALSSSTAHEAATTVSKPLDYHDVAVPPPPTCDAEARSSSTTAALHHNTPSSSSSSLRGAPTTQLSQTMDGIEGRSIALLGASSESDPWLLRHCRFDRLGLRPIRDRMHVRNAGGVPTADKIPVHFIVSDDKCLEHPLLPSPPPYAAMAAGDAGVRLQLSQLVPPTYGARLIRLFRKYVYPILPVIPNTYLDAAQTAITTTADAAPSPMTMAALDAIPTAVLAAMYGLALPFALNDELLAVVSAFEQPAPLAQQLWTLVHALIQAAIHRPSLSTVQAALLFLHGSPGGSGGGDDPSGSAFLWSFVGSTVGMAHGLGLQFECRMFGIPHADKRLRRRLWWALYIEDKWQSLLMGRPPYIRADEWDVGELCDADFDVSPPAASSYFDDAATTTAIGPTFGPFRDMARLAVIVADVQEKLYSLRACQKLAEDLALSISTAKPLFDRLNDWRSSVSAAAAAAPEPFYDNLGDGGSSGAYPTTAYFAYLTVVTYVWRALLRPTVRSSPPPRIIDVEEPPPPPPPPDVGGFFFEELSWDLSDLPEMELHLEEDQEAAHAQGDASGGSSSSATIKELHQAAQAYGGTVAAFTARLTSRHFDEFWYSWSRIGFAVVSNFLTVLLVQAPTAENTPRAKWMLESWRQTLRHQSRAFPILRLAMARLNAFYWGGLAETFCLPPHVQAVVS